MICSWKNAPGVDCSVLVLVVVLGTVCRTLMEEMMKVLFSNVREIV